MWAWLSRLFGKGGCTATPKTVNLSVERHPDGTATLRPSEISTAIPLSCAHCGRQLENIREQGPDAQWQMAMKLIDRGAIIENQRVVLQCAHCGKDMVIFAKPGTGRTLTIQLR